MFDVRKAIEACQLGRSVRDEGGPSDRKARARWCAAEASWTMSVFLCQGMGIARVEGKRHGRAFARFAAANASVQSLTGAIGRAFAGKTCNADG
eukprot:11163205-Lingulodinium_polyedra.AAC.1